MHTSENNQTEFIVGELIASSDSVMPSTTAGTVADRFFNTADLDALAVVEDNRPLGLITRTRLLLTLSRRFGNELYAKRPIIDISDTQSLTVYDTEQLDAVINKAFARPQQDIYNEIIVINDEGEYLGLLSVKQLVNQQTSALTRTILLNEVATARAQELERINQVKNQFLANVTHELRSPVNAILGLAELLKMAAAEGSMEKIQERLSFMISSATNLRAIITNILDLSKIEAGKMEVSLQPVEVVTLLKEIAETTRILVADKPVRVNLASTKETMTIVTDPIKLRQIVMNLAGNAAKFTEHGNIEINLFEEDEMLIIEVSDTGIGIREEDLHLIFTAFGQAEDAATKSHEGTGLGLTISRNLARLVGGTITVRSSFGRGSTFSVSLPMHHT